MLTNKTLPVARDGGGGSGWMDRIARGVAQCVPDAITASVILLLILAAVALVLGNTFSRVTDAYYRGLWMLLPFTMQMTLIVLLSASLSATPFFQGAIRRLAAIPRTANQTMALAVLLTAAAGYCYWGLGLTLGPVIAVNFAREAERKGLAIDFPFLLALLFASNSVWQYGLSATAPLLVAAPGHFLESTMGVIPLSRTIWSPAAILHVAAYTAALLACARWMKPRAPRAISNFPESAKLTEPARREALPASAFCERLESRPFFALALAGVMMLWLWHHFAVKQLSLDINSLNTILLTMTLLLHSNFKSFTRAVETAAASAWPVIVLYHLYAGLAGLLQFTTTGERLAGMAAAVSTPLTYPLLTAAIATVFAFFVPSSGGQWAIQGFVTVKSAMAVGVSAERGLLAMSVGDQMGNLTSPFWYVIAAGIVRIDFRSFFGYGLFFAALWFIIGVAAFTFAPC